MEDGFYERVKALLGDRKPTEIVKETGLGESMISRLKNAIPDSIRFDDGLELCEAYGVDPYMLAFGRAKRSPAEVTESLAERLARLEVEHLKLDRGQKGLRKAMSSLVRDRTGNSPDSRATQAMPQPQSKNNRKRRGGEKAG